MLPGMRFYIVSIVSIFTALGIGMYIGFSMDTQEFIIDQKENLTSILESQFEILIDESASIKQENKELKLENEYKDKYIESSYHFIVKNRLDGLNVGIIETNSDYVTSSIGKDLELAGAKVMNLTTLNESIVNKNDLDNTITKILGAIVNGEGSNDFVDLKNEGYIDCIGNYGQPIDYLIISGGAFEDSIDRINKIDKLIVNLSRVHSVPLIGVEKSDVNYSYMESYKNLGITTVDNVDMTLGKVAMILAMEGIDGNYGIKSTAKSILPLSMGVIFE